MSHQRMSHNEQGDGFATTAPLDTGAMLRVVWHGKWVIALCTLVSIFLGGYYAFHMTSAQYSATATLQIDAQPANLGDVSQHWPTPATDAASLNTEVALLTSDSLLRKVIARENLLADPEFNRYLRPVSPYVINTLRAHVRNFFAGTTNHVPSQSDIENKTVQNLRGTLTANRPRDTLIFQISARSQDPDKAATLANAAAAVYIAAQVQAKDDASKAAIDWLGERVTSLRRQLERQEKSITDLIASAQIQEETSLDALSNAVLQIDQERATTSDALAQYGDGQRTMRQISEMAQLRDQIALIDARRARLSGQLASQSAGLIQLQQMQREADTTRVLYRSFLARLQETQVQQGLEYPNSRIIAPATAGHYVGPRKTLIVEISAMLGVLLGLAAVCALQMGRRGVLHPDVLQCKTSHRVLTTLPSKALQTHRRQFHATVSATRAQRMRKILGGLMLCSEGRLPKRILVTATRQGEDKTALALTLSRSLASRGGTVLFIQGDPASRSAQKPMHGPPHLPAHTFDPSNIIPDADLGCDVLHIGSLDCLLDGDWAQKFDVITAPYAHVVINAPTMSTGPEAQILTNRTDAIIYAVKWAKTPLQNVLAGLNTLSSGIAAPAIGIVITQTNSRKMRSFGKIFARKSRTLGIT